MKEQKTTSPLGIGCITILTVLLVLTLSIFSALTLTTARADLSLSQISAQSVQDYYEADREAAALYAAFAAGTQAELLEELPVGDNRTLTLHLLREADGSIAVLAWDVTPVQPDQQEIDDTPDLWDGSDPS